MIWKNQSPSYNYYHSRAHAPYTDALTLVRTRRFNITTDYGCWQYQCISTFAHSNYTNNMNQSFRCLHAHDSHIATEYGEPTSCWIDIYCTTHLTEITFEREIGIDVCERAYGVLVCLIDPKKFLVEKSLCAFFCVKQKLSIKIQSRQMKSSKYGSMNWDRCDSRISRMS